MYPAFACSSWAPGHHGNQRACDLISGQTSAGHLGHQRLTNVDWSRHHVQEAKWMEQAGR
jgi:hypothetical protein